MAKETKAQKIQKKIEKLLADLKDEQTKCFHKALVVKPGENTGNYDPSADCYWVNLNCPDCLKRWTVFDDDKEEYHKYVMMRYKK